MKNINDTTFFDYLDGLLSPEDKQQFENYIANNPEAKSKLDKLMQEESAYLTKVESDKFEKMTDKYSFEINKLQEVKKKILKLLLIEKTQECCCQIFLHCLEYVLV